MTGLRELKKQRTRQAIRSAAADLFIERGFDRVSVTEIAAAAEVAEKTVFNYFPTKEALFFDNGGAADGLVDAIQRRTPDQSPIAVARHFITGLLSNPTGRPGTPFAGEHPSRLVQVIVASPALQSHVRDMFVRCESAISRALAAQAGVDPDHIEPQVVAVALCGVLRALYERLLHAVAADGDPTRALTTFADEAERAFTLLEAGLGTFATPSSAH